MGWWEKATGKVLPQKLADVVSAASHTIATPFRMLEGGITGGWGEMGRAFDESNEWLRENPTVQNMRQEIGRWPMVGGLAAPDQKGGYLRIAIPKVVGAAGSMVPGVGWVTGPALQNFTQYQFDKRAAQKHPDRIAQPQAMDYFTNAAMSAGTGYLANKAASMAAPKTAGGSSLRAGVEGQASLDTTVDFGGGQYAISGTGEGLTAQPSFGSSVNGASLYGNSIAAPAATGVFNKIGSAISGVQQAVEPLQLDQDTSGMAKISREEQDLSDMERNYLAGGGSALDRFGPEFTLNDTRGFSGDGWTPAISQDELSMGLGNIKTNTGLRQKMLMDRFRASGGGDIAGASRYKNMVDDIFTSGKLEQDAYIEEARKANERKMLVDQYKQFKSANNLTDDQMQYLYEQRNVDPNALRYVQSLDPAQFKGIMDMFQSIFMAK